MKTQILKSYDTWAPLGHILGTMAYKLSMILSPKWEVVQYILETGSGHTMEVFINFRQRTVSFVSLTWKDEKKKMC